MIKNIFRLYILIFIFTITSNCYAGELSNVDKNITNLVVTEKIYNLVKDLGCYEAYLSSKVLPFKDFNSSEVFSAYYWGVVKPKFTVEYDESSDNYVLYNVFKPEEPMTRGVLAEIFYTIICVVDPDEADAEVEIPEFADENDIIGMERAVKYMVKNGYMKLDENNKFNPYDNITNGEFTSLCTKIKKVYKK